MYFVKYSVHLYNYDFYVINLILIVFILLDFDCSAKKNSLNQSFNFMYTNFYCNTFCWIFEDRKQFSWNNKASVGFKYIGCVKPV